MKKLIALTLLASAPVLGMAQVTNGSFENPDLPTGTSATYPFGDTTIPNWQVIGDTNVQLIEASYLSGSGYNLAAADGLQWVDLTGFNEGTGKGLSTTFTGVASQIYTLTFYLGRLTSDSAASVNVLVDGTPFTFTNSGTTGGLDMAWQPFSFQFTSDGSTKIDFTGSGASNGSRNVIGLDNVSVVPEPATMVLALFAAAGLFGLRRLRDRS
jgi:Protein of unknown function (DUF642)/PEP-CTERM motif